MRVGGCGQRYGGAGGQVTPGLANHGGGQAKTLKWLPRTSDLDLTKGVLAAGWRLNWKERGREWKQADQLGEECNCPEMPLKPICSNVSSDDNNHVHRTLLVFKLFATFSSFFSLKQLSSEQEQTLLTSSSR